MEQADQTLHDFVLNLLGDSQAAAAFEQDPAAVLDHAGLSDISAADVQEVIPLVIDMVPSHADALDTMFSRLPIDSLDTGHLGAIQQLQFVTQALGGMPTLDEGGSYGNAEVNGAWHLNATADHGFWSSGEMTTPLGSEALGLAGDVENGLTVSMWDQTQGGNGSGTVRVPGLGGVPSVHAAAGDVADLLDGQTAASSAANASSAATNLLAGATDLAASGLANPAAVSGALSDPTSAVTAFSQLTTSYGMTAASALPAPASDLAGTAVHTVTQDVQGVGYDASNNLHTGPLSQVAGQSGITDATHGLGPVSGVVDQVTGHLPTGGGLGDVTSTVTGAVSDPTHAVQSTVSSVQGAVSDTVGSVASHSAVSDVTNAAGTGSALGSTAHSDAVSGLAGDVNHVTSDLHLPLF
jgi:hypothetical protein